ncbi:MAG: alanine--glyoxylate aminotransferase family protein [Methanobacteriota archaeon]|nr:MAG: alanine--glyoxylate aminotransferase family protein [Euryarchaeota archaeon]
MDLEDNVFMLPGPVKIHPRILRAMNVPSVAHRSPEFTEVIGEIRDLLKYLFDSDNDVAIVSGSGTAGLDMAICNMFGKEDKVLNITNGKFGERFAELSEMCSNSTRLDYEWGKAPDLDQIASELEKGDFKGITLCHNETSTGMTNPAPEIGNLAKKHDVLFIMDGITSVGGLEVKLDEWNVDVAVMGSQKCLGAPAGLAALSVSERAKENWIPDACYYLNLKKHVDKLREKSQTPYTPAVPLLQATREALLMLREEGLQNRIDRIARLGKATRAAMDALGIAIFPEREYASNTVTAMNYPAVIEDLKFRDTLKRKHNVILGGAQAHLKGKIFRIGTMGVCNFADLIACIGSIESTMTELGFELQKGAGTGAIVDYM